MVLGGLAVAMNLSVSFKETKKCVVTSDEDLRGKKSNSWKLWWQKIYLNGILIKEQDDWDNGQTDK